MSSNSKEHIIPVRTYLAVAAVLLALTGLTVFVAQFHFGEWNLVVAMTIAATKALLVAFIFMHLYYDNKLYFVIFAGSVVFLAVFLTLSMFDTLKRDDIYDFVEKPINPKAMMYQQADSAKAKKEIPNTAVPKDSTKSAPKK
jgi:cytochrome c oxidase subunit 4